MRITEADFFSAIFATLALKGCKHIFADHKFARAVCKIFDKLMEYAKQENLELTFHIRLHHFHGDSETVHNGILYAAHRRIISLDWPSNEVITIQIGEKQARDILNNVPGKQFFIDFADEIINIFFH